jgi:hypothetical protein
MKPVLLFLLIFVFALESWGQTDSISTKQSVFVVTPIIFRTPETSWGFGVGGAYNFFWNSDTTRTRPSQIIFAATYTLEDQILIHFPFQLFLRQNQLWLEGELGLYRYVYPYFGIGNETQLENREVFESTFPRVQLSGVYALRKNFYAGLSYKFDDFSISKRAQGGLLEQNQPLGYKGALISELAIRGVWDSRDNIYYPRKGSFITLDVFGSGSILGSTYRYRGAFLDAAKYYSIAKNHIIAGHIQWGRQDGNVPFFQLLSLGGPEFHRGYILGRYRDQRMALLQLAYRFPLFWRFKMETFTSYGGVSDSAFIPLGEGHWSAGLGLRFLVDVENGLHLRIDYARGADQTGIYITIGEAF